MRASEDRFFGKQKGGEGKRFLPPHHFFTPAPSHYVAGDSKTERHRRARARERESERERVRKRESEREREREGERERDQPVMMLAMREQSDKRRLKKRDLKSDLKHVLNSSKELKEPSTTCNYC